MSTERRQAYRFPSAPERSEALLKVGDETYRARLLDESATGFALHLDRHPGVYEHEIVWLLASGCWTKARIARIEADGEGVELGLSRITEPREPAEPAEKRVWFSRMPKDNRIPLMIAVAGLLTISLVLLLRDDHVQAEARPASEEVEAASSGTAKDLHGWLRDMGPSVYVAPEIVSVLRLSPRQIQLIEAIATRHRRAVELAKETGASLDEVRAMRLDAQQKARQVLQAHQRAKWDELIRLLEQQDPDQ